MEHFYKKLNNASTGDQFGYSVAIYNSQIIVGAPSNSNNSAVYIFILSNGKFIQAVKLTVATGKIGYSVALYGEVALLTNTVNSAIGSVYYINNITTLETTSESTNVFPAAYFAVVIILASIVYIIIVMRFMFRRNYLLGKFRNKNQPQRQPQINEMAAMGYPQPYLAPNVTVHIYDSGAQVVQQNSPSGCDYCCFIVLIFFFVSIICLIIVSTACRAPEQNNLLGITWLSGNAGCGFSVIMASPFLLLMVLPVLCCSSLCSSTCCACSCCYCPCSCPCSCDCCPSCSCPCNCPSSQWNCNCCNCPSTDCSNCCGTNNSCNCCCNDNGSCSCCANSTTTNTTTTTSSTANNNCCNCN